MGPRYVSLDLETTGLNSETDEIIEVGAVAFDVDGVLAEYQTFVQPYRAPPFVVERLTGIRSESLATAPHLAGVLGEVAEFIGASAVVGQNPAFDLAFLERAGLKPPGPAYDTFELAQILLPTLGDFSLRAIAAALEIDFPVRHRAAADADAARSVFLALRQRLAEQPAWILDEMARLAESARWPMAQLIREVAAEQPTGRGLSLERQAWQLQSGADPHPNPLPSPGRGNVSGLASTDILRKPEAIPKALSANDAWEKIDEEDVIGALRAAAELPEMFPVFEQRFEQEEMALAVTRALNAPGHLVVEAGTGTGKSLAYLLPAALYALKNRERVVVSTDTIGLQEQLTSKDLPAVAALVGGGELRVAQLKGRRNYLCLLRWSAARHQAPLTPEDARLHARLLVWLGETETGDRAELNLHGSYDAAWARLSAENTACLQTPCPFVKQGTCFLLRARRRAEAAHVLVVNHALLLSDVAAGGHVLPQYSRLVIDEAHNLEDEATDRLSFKAGAAEVEDFLDRIGRRAGDRSGLIGSLNEAMRSSGDILGPAAYLGSLSASLAAAAARARVRLADPFRLLTAVLRDMASLERDSDDRLLLPRAVRVQSIWSDVEIAAEELDRPLKETCSLLADLATALAAPLNLMGQDEIGAEVADLLQTGLGLSEGLRGVLLDDDPSLICWLERSRSSGEVVVSSAPLAVAEILKRQLFATKDSVILTSATLSAGGSFAFLRERVGLDDAEEMLLGSPFDYEHATMIALPSDLPEPNDPAYTATAAELLIDACRASQGRALVLFTSYGALNAAYDYIKGPLEAEGILVLAHGSDGSPRQLLAALRENPRTVILGTASFWEGIDVAGEALSLLVIARLPFAVPTDPIYEARSSLYDDPFEEYAIPRAVLRFRQGFGRLIRSKTDRGALIVLDRRLRSRKYGDLFLASLPRCTVVDLPAREIGGAVAKWLA